MHYYILMKVYQGCDIFLQILSYILVAYALLSWILSPMNRLYQIISRMAQPLVAPFRGLSSRLIQRGLRIDISVLLALLAVELVRGWLLPLLFNWLMTL